MTEPTLTCPSCRTQIKLTESLAAPLIEVTRRRYEDQLARKEAEVAGREAAIRDQQAQIAAARDAIDAQVAAKVDDERGRIAAAEAQKAKRLVAIDVDAKVKEIADLNQVLKQRDAKLAEAQQAQAENETEEEALQRIKASRYIIRFHHDKFWPFYDVEHKFGRVVLTINTAHPFYANLCEPLMTYRAENSEEDAAEVPLQENKLTTVLDLVLLSLARTQSMMSQSNDDASAIFDDFRQAWSHTPKVQLSR
jgi:multidrug efflux pump subunit AcrA (membrane-fusion protein)